MNYSLVRFSNWAFLKTVFSFRKCVGMMFGILITVALIFFEMFNFSTTDYALADLLGDMKFAGIYWSTILAVAFCGMDFAGIARLLGNVNEKDETQEAWYLFGAWLLAATMNAALTWWGVSMAVANHQPRSVTVVDIGIIRHIVPVFVAVMVWLMRVLIIGTITMAGTRVAKNQVPRTEAGREHQQVPQTNQRTRQIPSPVPATLTRQSVIARANGNSNANTRTRVEPVYQPLNQNRPAPQAQTAYRTIST